MSTTKLLLRAGMRLQEAWGKAAHRGGSPYWCQMSRVDDWHLAFMLARERLAKARRLGLSAILPGLEREVMRYLAHFQHVVDHIHIHIWGTSVRVRALRSDLRS